MKKQYVKILVRKKGNKSKSCEVLTYGYKSKNPELFITLDFYKSKHDIKSYGITHKKTGFGIFTGRFSSIQKAKKVINLFFLNCNWLQDKNNIVKDPVIVKQYLAATQFLNDNVI